MKKIITLDDLIVIKLIQLAAESPQRNFKKYAEQVLTLHAELTPLKNKNNGK